MLIAAWACCVLGFAWIALAMDVHWREVARTALRRSQQMKLRVAGVAALSVSLLLCLTVDHASIASLVWVMMLAAAALTVTFTLAWRARWLAYLVGRPRVNN